MRPLHGLILLLALIALLVGGLLWLGGNRSASGLEKNVAEAPLVPGAATPVTELSTTDSANAKAERAAQPAAAVHLEGSAASKEALGLSGRVVGPDGRPVPGAKVFAMPAGEFDFLPLDALDPKMVPEGKRADGVTDAEGRFQLGLSGQTHVRLAVRASGFAPLDAERTLARGERDLGDVALEQGVVLEGRVVDQTGRPVAEAQIHSRPRTAGFGIEMMGRGRPPLATTDAAGRFKIDMLASGPWRMLVSSEEHPEKTFDGETERPGAALRNLEFALDEGAQIAGHVTGAAGELLATLEVSAQQRAENDDNAGNGIVFGPGGFSMPRKAKVGPDGSFVVKGLKPNQNYRLDAQKAERGLFGFGQGARGGVSAKSGDRGIAVPYKPAPAIVCQVVDAASGKPLTELDVKAGFAWMMPLMDSEGKTKSSFPDGNVRFDRLPPRFDGGSALKLRIDATGYKSYESPELTPVEGQDLDLGVVRLERAPVCRVQVLDLGTGQPIAGAEVSLREQNGNDNGMLGNVQIRRSRGGRTINDEGLSQGTTGADGSVVLSSFPGKQATLKVKHTEYASWQSEPITLPDSSDHEQTVKLSHGGDVLVTVQDAQGRPVPGVEIEHAARGGEEQNPWMRRFSGEGNSRTDARGELLFAHLEPGSHRFRVASDGGMVGGFSAGGGRAVRVAFSRNGDEAEPPQEEAWTAVDVAEGVQAPLKLIAPMRGSVVGRVREGGKSLAGASIHFEQKGEGGGGFMNMPLFGGQNGPRTNGSGEYTQAGLKPGKYTVQVSHPARSMNWEGELEVTEGEQRYDVELPIAIVEGRILGPDGKPVAGARITAERAQEKGERQTMMAFSVAIAGDSGDVMSFGGSGGAEPVRSDADGRYTLRGLLTDTDLVVHVSGKDFSPANSEKFRCAPDQTVRGIDVKVKQGGILEVRVRRAGQPATGVLVSAFHKAKDGSNDSQQSEMTGPGGIARFTGLEPGEWQFSVNDFSNPDASPDEPESARTPVEIKPGETSKVDHDLH